MTELAKRRRALMVAEKASGKSDMNGWTNGVPYTDITVYNKSYYDATTGEVKNYNGWKRTGLIPCNGASFLRFPRINHNNQADMMYNWIFDGSRQPLQQFTISISKAYRIDIPANGAFFAISLPGTSLEQALSDGITPYA